MGRGQRRGGDRAALATARAARRRSRARSAGERRRAGGLLHLYEVIVAPEWIDYNGHMTEHRYLEVLANTTDMFLPLIGAGGDYAASGRSFYTVETHIRHLGEARVGDRLTVSTQLLHHDPKRLHVFHEIRRADDGAPVATGEHMLLHVDMAAGRAVPAGAEVLAALDRIAAAQAGLPVPAGTGRAIGAAAAPAPIPD